MTIQDMFITSAKQYMARLKPGLLYLFTALVLSLFCGQKMVAFGDAPAKETFLQKEISTLRSIPVLSAQFPKLELPFESIPTPYDCEAPNENEQEDDSDSECNLMAGLHNPLVVFDLSTTGNWFTQSFSSIYYHTSVPFFILYHSWKSFVF